MLNLALILTVLTVFTGVVVALDKFAWKTSEDDSRDKPGAKHVLVEYSRSFFPVLLLVLVIRSFVFEPFRIPSGSMMPTLLEGDFIFVKKYSYGLRLPVTETKIVETGSPARGDVIVFRLPSDPSVNYIKRVIGLPGDTVVYERHRLTINGERVALRGGDGESRGAPVYAEDLDGRVHEIRVENPGFSIRDNIYRVPEGHFFVMGDNRDSSKDSRFIGAIPEEYLVGEAVRVWMHFVPWNMPDWGRIGTKIQ
ncbi:MAG: signal peptidase I [Gammaproteobacteria bacterium]|nr:signal peptidase I [Gammaproteobacteria bacterium]NNF48895.1 signal peptidase I [Woeseiaceae bacterium]MBT8095018.1 signal peptidase I [Gammaproteobacteria bacterium]MBT8104688.1 signal peptidase I [Gammaproteobacteria bacterium]NNK24702.1 signal peptidase I [Woeseiaceae bacterium]